MSKAKKAQEMLEAAMKKASEDAQKLFKQHEKERRFAELQDKSDRDLELFDFTIEQERLVTERDAYKSIQQELEELRALDFKENAKHEQWSTVVDASWLPSVTSESEINAFLGAWREEQLVNEFPVAETTILISNNSSGGTLKDHMHLIRGDIRATKELRQRRIDVDLELCKQAKLLTDELLKSRDRALMSGDTGAVVFVNRMLKAVYTQILDTLDVIACNTLQYYDLVLDHPEDETLVKQIPKESPMIKYGLWIKIKEATRSFTTLRFSDIGVSLDPKDSTVHKLPKALGLSKENVAMRVMQLSFDPYGVWVDDAVGQEFYTLDCLLVVEPMSFAERPKKLGEWLHRAETAETHRLHKQEYPPKASAESGRNEDPSLRVSFEVPENVVIRQKSLLIGKWNAAQRKWDPCGHCNLSGDSTSRKTSFVTSDLTTMAIIQEKGFDVPYEQWQLFPLGDDQVLFVIEGRRRGEVSDREIKILVCEGKCKLLFPEEKELTHLRENWLPPATLLRLLSRAGYNLLLTDYDAEFTPGIRPKTKAMEEKGYHDISLFCTRHAIASTRHNKLGENRDMALFRISRDSRPENSEEPLLRDVDDDNAWLSIRYERERCVISKFRESEPEPNLSNSDGKVTHLNFVMLMANEYGDNAVKNMVTSGNKLLQHAVLQLLHLTRPFTWG